MPNIDEAITVGLELEGFGGRLSTSRESIISRRGFVSHYDASVVDDANPPESGCEYVTQPVTVNVKMSNEGKGYRMDPGELNDVIRDLCAVIPRVNKSCGVHVHLGRPGRNGRSDWKPMMVRTMLQLGWQLEPVMFDLCPDTRRNNSFCLPLASHYGFNEFTSFYPTGRVLPRKCDNPKRYCWLNLIETQREGTDPNPGRMSGPATGTIENRMLGHTNDPAYISAWVSLWVKLASFVAYLDPTFVFAHCCFDNNHSIASEISVVRQLKPANLSQITLQRHTVEDDFMAPSATWNGPTPRPIPLSQREPHEVSSETPPRRRPTIRRAVRAGRSGINI